MLDLHVDLGVFVRSVGSRGYTEEAVAAAVDLTVLLDAAGRDVILIDTVGATEAEVHTACIADVVVLVLAPVPGGAAQAGLSGSADVIALNKMDQPGADEFEREWRSSISRTPRQDGWLPPIVRTVATEERGTGQVDVWALRLSKMLRERLLLRLPRIELYRGAQDVVERRRDPYTVVVAEWLRLVGTSYRP